MTLLLSLMGCAPSFAADTAKVGSPAPGFELPAVDGSTVSLADYADQVVVLEWFNPGCPFVKYAHGPDGPLRTRAQTVSEQGVAWLAINSGAPGKQGHGLQTNLEAAQEWEMKHPVLLDEEGVVGRLYGASTTPQMAVIDHGTLVYWGGLDNRPMGKDKGGEAVDYVDAALADVAAGRGVLTPEAATYGCSVKYGR
jgi:hypothetical protein